MSGGIWAAYAPGWGFRLAARVGQPFATLSDAELGNLKDFVSRDA